MLLKITKRESYLSLKKWTRTITAEEFLTEINIMQKVRPKMWNLRKVTPSPEKNYTLKLKTVWSIIDVNFLPSLAENKKWMTNTITRSSEQIIDSPSLTDRIFDFLQASVIFIIMSKKASLPRKLLTI